MNLKQLNEEIEKFLEDDEHKPAYDYKETELNLGDYVINIYSYGKTGTIYKIIDFYEDPELPSRKTSDITIQPLNNKSRTVKDAGSYNYAKIDPETFTMNDYKELIRNVRRTKGQTRN